MKKIAVSVLIGALILSLVGPPASAENVTENLKIGDAQKLNTFFHKWGETSQNEFYYALKDQNGIEVGKVKKPLVESYQAKESYTIRSNPYNVGPVVNNQFTYHAALGQFSDKEHLFDLHLGELTEDKNGFHVKTNDGDLTVKFESDMSAIARLQDAKSTLDFLAKLTEKRVSSDALLPHLLILNMETQNNKVDTSIYTFNVGHLSGDAQTGEYTIFSNVMDVDARMIKNEYNPFIENGSTYIPIRTISEMLGLKVDYNEGTGLVTLTDKKGIPVEFDSNGHNRTVKKSGADFTEFAQDSLPIKKDGVLFVPLRFFSEVFKNKVYFRSETNLKQIIIVNAEQK
ncbi:copper amine oxidase N-terminal domain-containing protein [Paenibacillus sp. SYP-B3998]|uniref:Copper amine oxidase N-terminal domain-containing protein n=1 Tax=Paenibacillus sp. SYP-B3998 TaxID=2678564 RepID=A0A6G4A2I2_9BACL|nr:copper amine oxidase N-terminal domain-containing protein [Paenibacillus sp. SYP-B3998]NEW08031.1 copper amine oxidase N-terminal domain-containing protein [Paenibacillus sp. SYP-B3998]